MKSAEFNKNYEIDRKSRGVKAMAKHAPAPEMPKTADGTTYDPNAAYYFFDESAQQVRRSDGLRLVDDHLCGFGLKIVAVSRLHLDRDSALAEAQTHCKEKIERLQKQIAGFELEKSNENRSLKSFLTAKE